MSIGRKRCEFVRDLSRGTMLKAAPLGSSPSLDLFSSKHLWSLCRVTGSSTPWAKVLHLLFQLQAAGQPSGCEASPALTESCPVCAGAAGALICSQEVGKAVPPSPPPFLSLSHPPRQAVLVHALGLRKPDLSCEGSKSTCCSSDWRWAASEARCCSCC